MKPAHEGSVLDYVAAAVLELDAEGRVRSANAAAQRLLRRADLDPAPVGLRFAELWSPADDAQIAVRQALAGTQAAFRAVACDGDGLEAGEVAGDWCATLRPVIEADGAVHGIIATCVPTGDGPAAGRRERSIAETFLDCSRTGLAILSRDLDILRVNPMMEQWYSHSLPLVGRKCHEVFYGHPRPCGNCPALRAMETNCLEMEVVPLVTSEGMTGWLELYASPFRDDDGAVAGVVEHVLDVTERVRREQRLQTIARMGAVGQLAGGVAHEFNNIMASIMGYAQLAMQQPSEEHITQALAVAETGCRRGKQVTDGLLAFSSPVAPSRDLTRIESCVDNALALLQTELISAHIEVVRGDASHVPDLTADQRQMEQVFLNLLMNAWQAMPDGGHLGITFTVALCDTGGADRRCCHIEVSDTGVGMAPSELERIFDPFFTTKGRLGNSDTPGLGLGLSIAHGVVAAHEGTMHVRSAPGQGTSMTVCLPLPKAESHTHRTEESMPPEAPPQGRGKALRILVAEDEDPLRELLCEILRARGHEVSEAPDGQKAIRALRSAEWDLVITDILMPKANGTELLKEVRASTRKVPCIVISGRGEDILKQQAIALGAAVCLRKPFDIGDILKAVDEAMATATE
jgi:signal transduction histidine kinase